MQQLAPSELGAWLSDDARDKPVLLDVREAWEVQVCSLPAIEHMPMGTVPSRMQELDPDAPVVCICHHGMRSLQVAAFLERNGFADVYNLSGGMDAWARQIDRGMATY